MTPFWNAADAGLVVNFLPTDLAGLALWLKPDSLSLSDGASLTSWPDNSSNNYAVTPPGTAPTWDAAAGAVKFVAASSQKLSVPDATDLRLTSGGNVFIVLQAASLPGTGTLMSFMSKFDFGPLGYDLRLDNTGGIVSIDSLFGGDTATNVGALSTTDFQLFDTYFDSTDLNFYINSTLGNNTSSPFSIGGNTKPLNIGGFGTFNGSDIGRYFDGWIKEVVIYNGALSSGDATSVRNYLNAKYALY